MSNVTYTKALTYSQLKKILTKIAKEYNATLSDELSDQYKVSSAIRLTFKDKSYVEFYDYKQTNLYDDKYPTVAKFRKTKYEYHVQGSSQFLTKNLLQEVNS